MHTRTVSLLLFFAALMVCACTVEPTERCSTDADCRYGRVCVDSLCTYPGSSTRGTVGPYDGGSPDSGSPDNRSLDRSDGSADEVAPVIRFEPDSIWFGTIPPRQTAVAVVQVSNSGGGTLRISEVWVTDEVFSVRELNSHTIAHDDPPVLIEVVALVPYDVEEGFTVNGALYVESNASNLYEGAVPLGVEVRAEP